MSGEFLDSNVFVYLFDDADKRKRGIADGIVESALEESGASISFQVVQETLNVLTRKLPEPMTAEDAGLFLARVLAPLWRIWAGPGPPPPGPGGGGQSGRGNNRTPLTPKNRLAPFRFKKKKKKIDIATGQTK